MQIIAISLLIASFCITFFITPFMQKIAFKWNILDIPNGQAKQHKKPTPYLGGVALYIGFIVPVLFVLQFDYRLSFFMAGALLSLLVGLIDDLIDMSPLKKALGQLVAILCFIPACFSLGISTLSFSCFVIPLFIFWAFFVVNAFNLIDVMDGLAATSSLLAAIGFCFYSFALGSNQIFLLIISLVGSLSAFLYYNKPDAKIYLGDAGALFLGGFFCAVPFFLDWSKYNSHGYFIPLFLLAIPLLETGSLIIIRTLKKIPFYRPSPDHFSLLLQQKAWPKGKILQFVVLFSIANLGVSFFVAFCNPPLYLIGFILLFSALLWLAWLGFLCITLFF